MPTLPKISVVTPSFNSTTTIRETIESVRRQDYPKSSTSLWMAARRTGRSTLLKEYPHLLWVSEKDEGHYHAMNKGIERATGEVVAILNADDCYRPGALRHGGRALAAHPDWDGLFGDVVFVDGQKQEIYRREEAIFDYDVLRYSGVGYVIHPTLFVKAALHAARIVSANGPERGRLCLRDGFGRAGAASGMSTRCSSTTAITNLASQPIAVSRPI